MRNHTVASWEHACKCYTISLELKTLIGCRLNGLGAGPAETAQPTIIADVIFLHDRGKYQALYFASYFGSLTVSCSHRLEWRH